MDPSNAIFEFVLKGLPLLLGGFFYWGMCAYKKRKGFKPVDAENLQYTYFQLGNVVVFLFVVVFFIFFFIRNN